MAARLAREARLDPPEMTGRELRVQRDLQLQRGRRLWVDTEAEARNLIRDIDPSIFVLL